MSVVLDYINDMDLTKEGLLFICVGTLISDVHSIQAPRWVSGWITMEVNIVATTEHTWTHGFGVVPYMHEVQVMSPSGFIYPGIKSGDGDNDDPSQPRGGVICFYNENDVMVFSASGINTAANLINTGTTSYTNQNQERTTSAEVRVRLWHPDDFPSPAQTLDGIDLKAGDDTNNYEAHTHTLGQVPALTIVQVQFTYQGTSWYGEAMGSSNHLSGGSSLLQTGGIVFGVDATTVQLWAPSTNGVDIGVINICDGWGHYNGGSSGDCSPKDASIIIRMWTTLGSALVFDVTTSHTLTDSADSHEYPIASTFNVTSDLVVVESTAVDGVFSGYHFYATGAAIYDGAGELGGMIYAYSSSAVRLWHPITSTSYLIKVGRYMGPTSGYAHVSTQTSTRIRIWKGSPTVNNCSYPDSGINTQLIVETISVGSVVTYTCESGYSHVAGNLSIECVNNGSSTHWDGITPECQASSSLVCFDLSATGGNTTEAILIAEQIVANLTVPTKTTSKYLRSLTSAKDDRASSTYIGVFSGLFCFGIFILIVLSDVVCVVKHLYAHCTHRRNKIKFNHNS